MFEVNSFFGVSCTAHQVLFIGMLPNHKVIFVKYFKMISFVKPLSCEIFREHAQINVLERRIEKF